MILVHPVKVFASRENSKVFATNCREIFRREIGQKSQVPDRIVRVQKFLKISINLFHCFHKTYKVSTNLIGFIRQTFPKKTISTRLKKTSAP